MSFNHLHAVTLVSRQRRYSAPINGFTCISDQGT